MNNLFSDIPISLPEELFETLVQAENIHIERIVSHGHASPEGSWYDQDQSEFVVLLKGAARLRMKDDDEPVEMKPGVLLATACSFGLLPKRQSFEVGVLELIPAFSTYSAAFEAVAQ